MKLYVAYQAAAFRMTFSDLQANSPNAGLAKCDLFRTDV